MGWNKEDMLGSDVEDDDEADDDDEYVSIINVALS